MTQQEPFQIWNEKFSVGDAKKGWIYKIYFANFPQHCYIGTTDRFSKSIKVSLRSLKIELFKVFSGIAPFDLLSKEYLLSEKEYQNLTSEQRESYNRKLVQRRQDKILDFEQDLFHGSEWKYWKMMMFMDLHHLDLNDLRIELLEPQTASENWDDFLARQMDLIDQHDAYVSGFNSQLIVEFEVDEGKEIKSTTLLKTMKKLFEETDNQYLKFNCWWNLYQTFKVSFMENTLIWMDAWDEVTVPEVIEGCSGFTQYLYENKKGAKIPNFKILDEETQGFIKKYPSNNAKFFLNNQHTTLFKNKVDLEEWIKNDAMFFLLSSEFDLIAEKEFLEFYGSWEEIQDFFEVSPFNHDSGFKTNILPIFTDFIEQVEELDDYWLSLQRYERYLRMLTSPSAYIPNYMEKEILFDYYFTQNFLNSLVFQF